MDNLFPAWDSGVGGRYSKGRNQVTTQTAFCEGFGELSVPWEQVAKLERKEECFKP